MGISGENVYLFRHALLRDAAYQLQLPSTRARLHELAFELVEAALGGRAPHMPALDLLEKADFAPHSTDAAADELAGHALAASEGPKREFFLSMHARYLRRHAEHCQRSFRNEEAVAAWRALSLVEGTRERCAALQRSAEVLSKSGRRREAEDLLIEALKLQRSLGDSKGESALLGYLGMAQCATGRHAEAEATLLRAHAMLRDSRHARLRGLVVGNLASIYYLTGRPEEAEQHQLMAAAALEEAGDKVNRGILLSNLGLTYHRAKRHELADATLKQALTLHRQAGDRRTEGITIGHLALLLKSRGDSAGAEAMTREALAIHRQVGNRASEGMALPAASVPGRR